MSQAITESYLQSKLKRLDEVNQYNQAKLALFQKKKNFLSRKEYERYKRILFESDYRVQPSHKSDSMVNQENTRQQSTQLSQQQQQSQQPVKTKKPSVTINDVPITNQGSIVTNQKSHRSQNSESGVVVEQTNQSVLNKEILNNDRSQLNLNQSAETFVYKEEEFLLNQQLLQRNIRLIEMEKKELENQLDSIKKKESMISRKAALTLSRVSEPELTINPAREKFQEMLKKQMFVSSNVSLQSVSNTPAKRRASAYTLDSTRDSDYEVNQLDRLLGANLCVVQLKKKIGLDFESQWNLIEKWEGVEGPIASRRNLSSFNATTSVYDNGDVARIRFGGDAQKRDHWEVEFNKIGKTLGERQMHVDDKLIYLDDFVGKNTSKKYVSSKSSRVNKQVIDRLSEDIELLMQYQKMSFSQRFSPFKNKRSLFEIPEEQYSNDTSVNHNNQ